MKRVQPIPATEIVSRQSYEIPDLVIVLVNNLLKERWHNNKAILYQSEIMNLLRLVFNRTESEILKMHWLDIEPIYRKAGYDVKYHKPIYGEHWDPYFEFLKPTKN